MTFAAGYSAVYQALVIVLIGVIAYAFIKARRERDWQLPFTPDLGIPDPARHTSP